jgi:large subunit ribosomal protein L29
MAYADLIKLDDKSLVHRELQLERELMEVLFRQRTGQLEDTSKMSKIRKEIARARTLQRDRENVQSLSKNALRDQHRTSFVPGEVGTGDEGGAGGFLKGIVDKVTPTE